VLLASSDSHLHFETSSQKQKHALDFPHARCMIFVPLVAGKDASAAYSFNGTSSGQYNILMA
jgi:hypothetical protein